MDSFFVILATKKIVFGAIIIMHHCIKRFQVNPETFTYFVDKQRYKRKFKLFQLVGSIVSLETD